MARSNPISIDRGGWGRTAGAPRTQSRWLRFAPTTASLTTTATLTLFAIFWLVGAAPLFGAETLSVEEFEAAKNKWPQWKEQEVKVEGRYSFVSDEKLKFRQCDLDFVFSSGLRVPKFKTRNAAVTGQLRRKSNGNWYVLVSRIREKPDDEDWVSLRMRGLLKNDPDPWVELGTWARARARFYDDEGLDVLANQAFLEGIAIAKQQLKPTDGVGLLKLAERAAQYGIPAREVAELRHEALRRTWNNGQLPREVSTKKFLQQVAELLPGSLDHEAKPTDELIQSYRKNPLVVYSKVADSVRKALNRHFYRSAVIASLDDQLDDDDGNADEIAAQFELYLPNEKQIAAVYRDRYLKYQIRTADKLSRKEAQQLVEQLLVQDDRERAETVRQNWLAARKAELSTGKVFDTLILADHYTEFGNDRDAAAKLLLDAIEKHPDFEEIEQRLKRLGYEKVDDAWLSKAEMQTEQEEDEVRQALIRGEVVKGMTPRQVSQALGRPSTITRITAASSVLEVWIYRDARLMIRFERPTVIAPPEVISIDPLKIVAVPPRQKSEEPEEE